jgi:hypothetical protein
LPLDRAAKATEALPALIADRFRSAKLQILFVLNKYPVPPYSSAQPRGERFPVRGAGWVHLLWMVGIRLWVS